MSRFLSAWVGRPIGDAKPTIYCEPTIDSHEVLKTLFKVKAEERGTVINAARVEFTPSVGPDDVPDYLAFDKYELRVDENETPGWFDEDVKSFVVKALTKILKAMLIDDDSRPILYGGAWILGPNAKVEYADSCRVVALCGGTLTAMCGGTLTTMRGGTLTTMWGGTLTTMRGGTLTEMWGGTLTEMRGGTLTTMRGGTLTEMWGGTLTTMRGGTLTEMWGGTLTEMWGGTLTEMWGGTLTTMRGGTLTTMRGGTLRAMCGGTLTTMWGDYDPKVIWKYDADVPKGWKKDKSGLLVPANKKVKK